MGRPTSFRFSDDLSARLEEEAAAAGLSVSALVTSLLDEGLQTRRFPGIVFRDGPAGRRAGLVSGPDVWEIIRDVAAAPGRGAGRIRAVAAASGLAEAQVRLAVDYYAAFPDVVDERLAAEARAEARWREAADRRERLTG